MNKQEAIVKVKKILALANDRAATTEEKDTALKLANSIASKYNLKVIQGHGSGTNFNNFASEYKKFTFTPKNPSSKFVRMLMLIMDEVGYAVTPIMKGKSYIGFTYTNTISVNTTLSAIHKECFSYCNKYKAFIKQHAIPDLTSNKMTDEWCADVLRGACGRYIPYADAHFITTRSISLNFGKRITSTLHRYYKGGT